MGAENGVQQSLLLFEHCPECCCHSAVSEALLLFLFKALCLVFSRHSYFYCRRYEIIIIFLDHIRAYLVPTF